MRTPLRNLWPKIEGRWVTVSGQEDGRERRIDAANPIVLEFKDRQFHLTDGAKHYAFGLHVQPGTKRHLMLFFDPKQEFAKELHYPAAGLLKVSDDRLTVCLCLDLSKLKGVVDDFKAPAGSNCVLLEFRREKPRPATTADPLRSMLEKKGYVAVPLIRDEEGWGFIVKCRSGAATFRMLLDTGAEVSCLDRRWVKKFGLRPKREITGVGTGGSQKGVEVSLRELSIGDFDTRRTGNSFPLAAVDLTAMNTLRTKRRKLPPIDGVLGHFTLKLNSAVIDYSTHTLYLRTPLKSLWPKVEGRWVAVSGREDGRERRIDPAAPIVLEFKDSEFHLTDGAKRYAFGLHVQPDKDRYRVGLFYPRQEFANELDYPAGGLLKVSGDRLVVCLYLDPSKVKAPPADFAAPAGTGHLLLEFRRAK
jgi:hypothetical protein